MMAPVRSWLLGVVCTAMIAAVAECLVPAGRVKRVLRIAGGAALVLAVIHPFAGQGGNLYLAGMDYGAEAREYQEELQQAHNILYESIIEENTAAYISDKAKELGMTCTVSVTVAWKDEVPVPHAVRIRGRWTAEQRETLLRIVERDLGIPGEMQYFEESES